MALDALVSKVLDLLTSVISSQIEQKVKPVVGVEQDVKMLATNVQSIQAVLIDAEKRQVKEEAVKLWLHRLKNIFYEIDDVLDEWNTELLRSKIEGDDYEYAPKPKWYKFSFLQGAPGVGFRWDIAGKIKELKESLDVIDKEKDKYCFLQLNENERPRRVMSISIANITEVKGRKNDEEAVLNLLLAENERNPHVISIVGLGGIGKTALAKLVFNGDRVKANNFDKTIWVCTSDHFDEIRIAKAILESFSNSASRLVELQSIVQEIHKHIGGKKFLLVLDDVWNENSTKWEQVEQFLKCGLPRSKILVTTRSRNVARVMGCSDRDIIQLELLSDEECWSIFNQSVECNRGLEEIGKKIVGRCKGLPLAVKTIAGLLRFKKSVREWQNVLDSELWELEEVDRRVLVPLRLSYYDLPSALKECFLYCLTFPKDHRMSKKELIGMWMSQGYLRTTKNKDEEVIGDEYFQILVELDKVFSQLTCLRSLSLKNCGISEIPSHISELIHLRQLDLSYNDKLEELPETICKLYNLQTLNVDECRSLKVLPRGIGKLENLRSLYNYVWFKWRGCLLPKDIGKLTSLRKLSKINIGGEEDAYFSLRDLKNLDHLSGLLWIDWRKENVGVEEAKEAQLKKKWNIDHLILFFSVSHIGGEHGKKEDEEILEALEPSAPNLKYLEIWIYKGRCSPSWIKGLNFLTRLLLSQWTNSEQLPHSLGKLPFLQCLDIRFFKSLKKVGVEFYAIMDDDDDKAASTTIFPKLIELSFWVMEEWEEWKELEDEEEDGIDKKKKKKKKKKKRRSNQLIIMPSLQSLTLSKCPKLKALPNYILQKDSLKHVIEGCDTLDQTLIPLYGLPQPEASSSSMPSL